MDNAEYGMPEQSLQYAYDVTLSFAEEDRAFVEQVAKLLRQKQLRIFYDDYERIDTWGRDLYTHLDEVYRKKGKYCVIFISEHYKRKLWTQHERESAQARAFQEHREYILPFRFDNTEIAGIRDTIAYLSINDYNENKLAEAIIAKVNHAHPAPLYTVSHPLIGLTYIEKIRRAIQRRLKLTALIVGIGFLSLYSFSDQLSPVGVLAERIRERSKRLCHGTICADSSFSKSRGGGTCSHHGGAAYDKDSVLYDKTIEQSMEEAKQLSWLPP